MSDAGERARARRDGLEGAVGAAGRRWRRIEQLSAKLLNALAERDRIVQRTELSAGEALRAMTDDEGLTLAEAVERCVMIIDVREAARLLRLARGANRRDAD